MANRVVIMNEGRVQQIGAPREIYRRAANRFVAEFVGGNNIISGTARAVNAGLVTLDGPVGTVTARVSDEMALKLGDEVVLVVAADRIELAAKPVGIDNEIAARIATVQFVGSTVTVFLETDGGGELRVQRSLHDIEETPLEIGQPVVARWSPKLGFFVAA